MNKKYWRVEKRGTYNVNYAKDHEILKPEDNLDFKEIFRLYKPPSRCSILEIGCNTGEFCYLLKEKYNAIPRGVDINGSAISIAKKKISRYRFSTQRPL